MLPLRITFAFKGKGGMRFIDASFSIAERLTLYIAEFESDKYSFDPLLNLITKRKLSAQNKIIRISDTELFEYLLNFKDLFSEIQFELPYSLAKNKLEDIFYRLDKYIKSTEIVISFYANRSNISLLEHLLELSIKFGIKKIVIPNPDLINRLRFVKKNYLTVQDLNKLDIIKNYMDKIKFSIHDFFIAKRLGLKDADLFRGCQAGIFLCHILNGIVYPCKTIPIPCGNILKEPFEEIWKKVKNEINHISKGKQCINCKDSKICYYGCPGAVYFVNEGIKDPLCEERGWESI